MTFIKTGWNMITWLDWLNEWERQHWAWQAGSRPTSVIQGTDIHVVRGTTSRTLRNEITFNQMVGEWPRAYLVDNTLLQTEPNLLKELRFVPRFVPGAMVDNGGTIEGLGVRVDTVSGAVTAISPAPAGRLARNFYLDAVAKIQRDATHTNELRLTIRIHVHDRVKELWLTPSPLTVHQGSGDQRVTVLAELVTDGEPAPPIIGDLSRLTGIQWSCVNPAVKFGPMGEIDSTELGTFTIRADLPADWGGKSSTGDIQVLEGWQDKPSIRATLLAGPGRARLAEVPNVLLIPDGFTADQEADWDTIVAEAVDDMAKQQVNRPFDLFLTNNSINFWSLFIPSRQAGSSALYELTPYTNFDHKLTGVAIPEAFIPSPGMANWDVIRVLGHAGLPVRSDALPATMPEQQAKYNAKLAEWTAMFGPVTPAQVPFQLWQEWANLSNRTLADERDTALGLSFGTRPSYRENLPDRAVSYHPFRTRREHLDKLLARITDGDGPIIGHVWVQPVAGESRPEAGKDRNYVLALIGGARAGGSEIEGNVVASSAHDDPTLFLKGIGQGLRWEIVPHDLPRSVTGMPELPQEQRATIVHELAHAFGLQDEYAEYTGNRSALPPHVRRNASLAGNVQPLDELVDPSVPIAQRVGDGLIGDRLRWRAPRIARAAVLADAVVQMGQADEFVLPLRKGQKLQFKKGDVVFLRQRPLRKIVVEGAADARHAVLKLAKVSGPLVVISDNQVEEQIVVSASGGLVPGDFTATPPYESVVFVPVPAPPDAAAANETAADLVPFVVRQQITKTGRPLNRAAGTCAVIPPNQLDWDPRQQVQNAPVKVKFGWLHRWVGAFDGGMRYGCGIYHPSPICAMNHTLQRYDNETQGTYHALAPFCPVCSYLLVDAIDPSLHGEIDKLYAPDYVVGLP